MMRRVVAEEELENIVDIKIDITDLPAVDPQVRRKQLLLREALVEWDKQQKLLETKVEKRTKRKDQLTNEIYQLVGLYSVFVGVVFTAVLQSNRVECQHVWSPIALCLVAYFVILFVTIKKFGEIKSNTSTIKEDDEARKRAYLNTRKLITQGHTAFDFSTDVHEEEPSSSTNHIRKRSRLPVVVISILTLFTSVLLVSFGHVLCINVTKCKYSN